MFRKWFLFDADDLIAIAALLGGFITAINSRTRGLSLIAIILSGPSMAIFSVPLIFEWMNWTSSRGMVFLAFLIALAGNSLVAKWCSFVAGLSLPEFVGMLLKIAPSRGKKDD